MLTDKRQKEIIDDLHVAAFFKGLDAKHLFEALCERLEPGIDLEESELKAILDEIAVRLGGCLEHQWDDAIQGIRNFRNCPATRIEYVYIIVAHDGERIKESIVVGEV